jgi:hypothetical protein
MEIGNDRLYQAVQVVAFGKEDVRYRVATACQIMRGMSANEVDIAIRLRIDEVLKQASTYKAMRDSNGDVIAGYDTYEVSASKRQKSTYVPLAKEIFSIYEDDLMLRKQKEGSENE